MIHELTIPLPNGGFLCCGPGETYDYGGYLRICDADGNEILYWDVTEWEAEGESVIGACMAAATKSIAELTADRTLDDGVWVFRPAKQAAKELTIDELCGDSIVRRNLLTRPFYSPYCGRPCDDMPRTTWVKHLKQFRCKCGWVSAFPPDFIAAYEKFRVDNSLDGFRSETQ